MIVGRAKFSPRFAYDSLNDRLYYSQWDTIYRSNPDGSDAQVVYQNQTHFLRCELLQANLLSSHFLSISYSE